MGVPVLACFRNVLRPLHNVLTPSSASSRGVLHLVPYTLGMSSFEELIELVPVYLVMCESTARCVWAVTVQNCCYRASACHVLNDKVRTRHAVVKAWRRLWWPLWFLGCVLRRDRGRFLDARVPLVLVEELCPVGQARAAAAPCRLRRSRVEV